jgi:hypothetical protein
MRCGSVNSQGTPGASTGLSPLWSKRRPHIAHEVAHIVACLRFDAMYAVTSDVRED